MLNFILGLSVDKEQPCEAFSLLIWVCYFAGDNVCKTANITCPSLLVSSCTLIIEELIT